MYRKAKWKNIPLLVVIIIKSAIVNAQDASNTVAKGHLILCGGVGFPPEAVQKFVDYAGGAGSGIVFIASASASIRLDNGFIYDIPETETDSAIVARKRFAGELARVFGVKEITVIDTREKTNANSPDYLQAVKNARGIWLGPGNAGRYADAFLGTLFQRYLDSVLFKGGVVAGNSAGAIIQGSYIVRGRPDKPLLMAPGHEKGFGWLNNIVINPHLSSAKRETELVNVLDKYPQLLGIGIDDDISLVFTGNVFEIFGKGITAIYDNQLHNGKWWYLLQPGTKFDIYKRQTVQ